MPPKLRLKEIHFWFWGYSHYFLVNFSEIFWCNSLSGIPLGSLDAIQIMSHKKWWKNIKPWQKHQENWKNWTWLPETPDFAFSIVKNPLFSLFLGCMWTNLQKQGWNLQKKGSQKGYHAKRFLKSWPKSSKNSPKIKNGFPITLISEAKKWIEKPPNVLLNP